MENRPSLPESFGELLKIFRKRQRLTQRQLAQQLGVHMNTISSWEVGTYLPAMRGLVLELARLLALNESEKRQLLEASLIALSPYWLVPLKRNPLFTGREKILEALHARLGINQIVALTQSSALHGLGGVGKTQIALEYAYRYALEYSATFWIRAEAAESIISDFLSIAESLQLPERNNEDHRRAVVAVQHWLSMHGQWLLIWDNVEDLALLDRFLPSTRQGAILITTRCQTLGTLACGLDLFPMEQKEGMLFLLRRAKMLEAEATCEDMRHLAESRPGEYAVASELVEIMGGLPLALDQAGAYLEAVQCGLPAYLELFRTRRAELLKSRGEGARDHPASVSTTFTLALAATTQRHPAVGDLLRICAFLQPDAIPEEFFRRGAEHLGSQLQLSCRDPLEWDRMVSVACSSSLLSRQPEERSLSMHRLVQAVLLDEMSEAEQKQWNRRVMMALDAVFPDIRPATAYIDWRQGERLLPHALLCLHRAASQEESLPFASLAYKAAQYLRERGRYGEAEPLLQRALQIRIQTRGQEHPDVASCLDELAILSFRQGKYEQAEPLHRRALHIWEKTLGSEDLQVARPLYGLARLHLRQGKYEQAEPFYRRALHIWEKNLGPEHPEVAKSLDGLAILYSHQGKYEQAEPLYRRALHIWEKSLGPQHPLVAYALLGLADLSYEQGKDEQAESFYRQALHIQEQTLGPEHPDLTYALGGLADIFSRQGKYEQAETCYRQALSLWEQTSGPEHPEIAYVLNGLANLSLKQGKYEEAERLYEYALRLREQLLGRNHPETGHTLHDLAILRQRQGKVSEAISLAERALSIRSRSLGDTHPHTIATRTLSVQLAQEQARLEVETAPHRHSEAIPEPRENEHCENGTSSFLHEAVTPAHSVDDPLQEFLSACCELHPRAWCRSADLWRAYEHWAEERQERFPLSRGAFITQLKAHGCRTDRTKIARIWRGIALLK